MLAIILDEVANLSAFKIKGREVSMRSGTYAKENVWQSGAENNCRHHGELEGIC